MARGRFISYLRVSTDRQGKSGLGLEAQRQAVLDFLDGGKWTLLGEHVEVESGRKNDRPQLAAALAACKRNKATLLIAKLDRLSRNAGFLLSLRDAGVDFVACDLPQADRFTVGILALVAEREAEMISARTRAALQAAKRRGVKLGGPNIKEAQAASVEVLKAQADDFAAKVLPIIKEIQAAGRTKLADIAHVLNVRGVPTARGGYWHACTVRNILARG